MRQDSNPLLFDRGSSFLPTITDFCPFNGDKLYTLNRSYVSLRYNFESKSQCYGSNRMKSWRLRGTSTTFCLVRKNCYFFALKSLHFISNFCQIWEVTKDGLELNHNQVKFHTVRDDLQQWLKDQTVDTFPPKTQRTKNLSRIRKELKKYFWNFSIYGTARNHQSFDIIYDALEQCFSTA